MIRVEQSGLRDASIRESGVRRAIDLVTGWIEDGILPGASLLISRGKRVAVEAYFGIADPRSSRPVNDTTLWGIASITKPMTAASVMACVDRGLLSLETPVANLLPEFMASGDDGGWRSEVRLIHLLTHTSGLAGFSQNNLAIRQQHLPIEAFIDSFLHEEVFFQPGSWHLYSSVAYGLAAEIVGRTLLVQGAPEVQLTPQQVYRDFTMQILKGLGVRSLAFVPNEEEQPRIAVVSGTGQEGMDWEMTNSAYYRSLGMPWGGMYATAADVLDFLHAFLGKAAGASADVLSRVARTQMSTAQVVVPEAPITVAPSLRDVSWDPHRPVKSEIRWGLGWEIKGLGASDHFGDYLHPDAFGHIGSSGTVAWVDPSEELAVVLLTNQAWMSGWPLADQRLARLANTVVAALD